MLGGTFVSSPLSNSIIISSLFPPLISLSLPPLPKKSYNNSSNSNVCSVKASLPSNLRFSTPSLLLHLILGKDEISSSRITSSSGSNPISARTRDGFWEDPDDGSGSDYEVEEEEEEEEEEVEDDINVNKTEATAQYEDELLKEVELLLKPEERAILQQNEDPVLSKIASMKWSPLHTLALSGQIPYMDKLLEGGVDIDAVDKDGYTALHKSVISKKEAVISHLLRKGANPHVRDRDGATALHYAVQVGAMQTVKLLIKYKVDVNVADDEGWTPLHVAIQSRCRDIAKVLLVNGADKTRRNKDGKMPLDLSLCFGRDFKSYELAKLLKLVPADREA
ncbi:ankyrin repeat domain-containing protein EMB506, chloroplastic isoform X1 [Magnolia sinica]|uniref:ankyrin repeat domain-containing protein EMB506, chloroplastic isoform X1 n=1 Tax=Magnolia sinica TaxID=86752 RepID=UPI002657FFF5|nr:ankyrin repeat domain-containing protein EMB506, chloroplastic isoform X1 [Magnolia sinica]XP_058112132.1 ankyrin repeat domain-containing protein EMB506, chloroplastic isoform X1 [Magnolia sinica]XP_058112133.1 ankyrin repeat domain-containing protein EMB506, chloroplastic isoform X1 [Magnolia sinica]XP_058112134.1 ankyrin repeat domain-containing protein EMB506, chloroplastic isoform X1 [Magnolia sinica]XP_058112135.1 ankyrin repeat domain-containing protein EMB506, chloroplastic isoform X